MGYLDPDESKYFLFTVNKVEGGLLTFPADGKDEDNVTLEIAQTNTGRSYSYENGKLVIKLEKTMKYTIQKVLLYIQQFQQNLLALHIRLAMKLV